MPDFFLRPVYRISPFKTADYSKTIRALNEKNNNQSVINKIKNGYFQYFTASGRQAIFIYLEYLNLKKNDEVTILTTTSSFYVSSCVTNTIERVCKWNREITDKTKCIIIIHEFGKFYANIHNIKKYNIPILEDFAHSFSALYDTKIIQGDAAIFSLPKFLPINQGGILLSKKNLPIDSDNKYDYLYNKYRNSIYSFIEKRKEIESIYIKELKELKKLNITPYFNYSKNEAPGAFVFKINKPIEWLQNLKEYLQSYFIECSVFYKNEAFFVPCHQELNLEDIVYISNLIKDYIRKNDNR